MAKRSADFELDGDDPVYIQIERWARTNIQNGAWPPGHRIPPELDLMKQAQCSRATVNKALTNLATAGLIVRHRRHGSYVRQSTEEHAVLGVLDIRSEIEASGRTYSYDVLERSITDADAEIADWPELTAGEPLLKLLAVHRGNSTAEVLEERLIRLRVAPEAETESFDEAPPNVWLLSRLPCTRLAHVIRAKTSTSREETILDVAPRSALLVSERRTWAEDQPVTWVRLFFPSDRNEFTGEFNPLDPGRAAAIT